MFSKSYAIGSEKETFRRCIGNARNVKWNQPEITKTLNFKMTRLTHAVAESYASEKYILKLKKRHIGREKFGGALNLRDYFVLERRT